jgi:hypothetical protein
VAEIESTVNRSVDQRLLALFGNEDWSSETDRTGACDAARTCEDVVGEPANAALVDRSTPKVSYWFAVGDTGVLVQVTGPSTDRTVLIRRPILVSRQVKEIGTRGAPGHSVFVTLKAKASPDDLRWSGNGRSADALLAFFRIVGKQLRWDFD